MEDHPYENTIHVFGNSHAALLTGAPPCGNIVPKSKEVPRGKGFTEKHPTLPFRTWFLGPVLAYNFFEKHFNQIKSHIGSHEAWFPPGAKIVLTCGEVDCRLHIPKQHVIHPDKSQQELVQEVVDRYFRVGPEIKSMGFEPIFFGIHPTTAPDHWFDSGFQQPDGMQGNWFEKGISEKRNIFCQMWNQTLKEKCEKENIKFVSIYEKIIDESGNPVDKFFLDPIHLSHDACIDFILEEFKKSGINIVPKETK